MEKNIYSVYIYIYNYIYVYLYTDQHVFHGGFFSTIFGGQVVSNKVKCSASAVHQIFDDSCGQLHTGAMAKVQHAA